MSGRPQKPKEELKTDSLRIMMATADKEIIAEAAKLDGREPSTWARELLLDVAKKRIAKKK